MYGKGKARARSVQKFQVMCGNESVEAPMQGLQYSDRSPVWTLVNLPANSESSPKTNKRRNAQIWSLSRVTKSQSPYTVAMLNSGHRQLGDPLQEDGRKWKWESETSRK